MKYLLIATALSFGISGACLAQTSMPSSSPSAHSKASTSPNGPSGQAMQPGQAKPCSTQASGTSDRSGGTEKRSTASGGPNGNPGGSVTNGNC
jgi:hypothetical protein